MSKARIGSVTINVITSEMLNHKADSTDHAVEDGVDITDHTKVKAPTISISGAVMGEDASSKLQQLKAYQENGELVTYMCRNLYSNMFIEDISTDHGSRIRNGYEFDIILKRVRVVKAKEFEIKAVNPDSMKPDARTNTKVKPLTNNGMQQVKAS